ncbi:MAG: FecR domain-containing protein [Bryobacteraceae bacterium]
MPGETLQTLGSSTAVVRLFDGSLIEMNRHSRISVERAWRGTTIRLSGGQVIVEAARQKSGRLYVATPESLVAVKGTIFSVNRGLKGTRVSVVEGEVQVDNGGRTESLKPGQQAMSDESLSATAVPDEITWSRNAARYLALLGEFQTLQRKLEAIPQPALRYQSKLLPLMPTDTVVYVAVPNSGAALTEAKRILDDQLRVSPALRDWWNQTGAQKHLDEMIVWTQKFNAQIGDEIAVMLFAGTTHEHALVTEARGAGLQAQIEELAKLHGSNQSPFVYSIHKGFLTITSSPTRLRQLEAIIDAGSTPGTPFRDRIAQTYRTGAGWLLAADVERIAATAPRDPKHPSPAELGFASAKYLVAERRDIGGKVENQAALNFSGPRTGIPAWLATPGALATLDFVSPDAGFAVAAVSKSPRAILDELFSLARKYNPAFDAHLAEEERLLGVRLVDDLAAHLGNEATFAVDGRLLPVPSLKIAVEVYSPARLQASIEKLVTSLSSAGLRLSQEQIQGRVFYRLTNTKSAADLHWTYADTFLVIGSTRALVQQALQTRQSGATLARSPRFRSQLPQGASVNFSAVMYHNLGGMLGPVIDNLKDLAVVTPEQRIAMLALRDTRPGVIVAVADPDRITASTAGAFGGFDLGMLATLDQLPKLFTPGGQFAK